MSFARRIILEYVGFCVIGKTTDWGERQLKEIICYLGNAGSYIRRKLSFATFLKFMKYTLDNVWLVYMNVLCTSTLQPLFLLHDICISTLLHHHFFLLIHDMVNSPCVCTIRLKILVYWNICTYGRGRFFVCLLR